MVEDIEMSDLHIDNDNVNDGGHVKAWSKPQLTVLARSTPEESVLATCKHYTVPHGGEPGDTHDGCKESCGACLEWKDS